MQVRGKFFHDGHFIKNLDGLGCENLTLFCQGYRITFAVYQYEIGLGLGEGGDLHH